MIFEKLIFPNSFDTMVQVRWFKMKGGSFVVVGVAQLAEHKVVALEVAGSSPVAHPSDVLLF